jgi:acyl carrier protein
MNQISEMELIDIVAAALEAEPNTVTLESSRETVEGWDSLGHLNILIALDKRTNGRAADIADLASAMSVGDILNLLHTQNLI